MRVAVVGATGAVGREMTRTLEERAFPLDDLVLLASERSAGTRVQAFGREREVGVHSVEALRGIDVSLGSAGASVSKPLGRQVAASGTVVIDNSSAFRQDADVPLVIPEVNGHVLDVEPKPGIVAN